VGQISVEILDEPIPGRGEVKLRMVGTGICGTDLSIYLGHLKPPMPIVLGHEGVGVVEELGPGVEGLALGDAVVCSIIAGCGVCYQCVRGARSLYEDVTFYTDDAVYEKIPVGRFDGQAEIRATLEEFFGPEVKVRFEIRNLGASGDTVYLERVVHFEVGDNKISLPAMAIFEVTAAGKISAWRDYFDRSQAGLD
jgi:limonene-1,2-epoxide hydrolase